jgi:hypothetical protein
MKAKFWDERIQVWPKGMLHWKPNVKVCSMSISMRDGAMETLTVAEHPDAAKVTTTLFLLHTKQYYLGHYDVLVPKSQ